MYAHRSAILYIIPLPRLWPPLSPSESLPLNDYRMRVTLRIVTTISTSQDHRKQFKHRHGITDRNAPIPTIPTIAVYRYLRRLLAGRKSWFNNRGGWIRHLGLVGTLGHRTWGRAATRFASSNIQGLGFCPTILTQLPRLQGRRVTQWRLIPSKKVTRYGN